MGISFRDFMESNSDSSPFYMEDEESTSGFQVFVKSLDEDIALLETITNLSNYRDHLNMLEYVTHGSQYPAQEFFKYVRTVNGIKHYETVGRLHAKCFEGSYIPERYKPFMFREVMEYHCEPPFANNSGDELNNDVEYNISDLIEV